MVVAFLQGQESSILREQSKGLDREVTKSVLTDMFDEGLVGGEEVVEQVWAALQK